MALPWNAQTVSRRGSGSGLPLSGSTPSDERPRPPSKSLTEPRRNRPQVRVHFRRRAAEDERAHRVLGRACVRVRAEDVHVLLGEHNTRARRVLDRKLDLAVLAGDTPDGAREVVTLEDLHGRHLERVDEEVLDAGERDGVGDLEADVKEGRISISSPISRALIGKEVGDSIEVIAPGGARAYEILEVVWK